ncbi:MAG: class I SAM-dependent methyltransferase [Gammaproteobacteria bacterium]|nr:class I SAM-dependent methyltransferase [Gammaproteobacteria bacterium]
MKPRTTSFAPSATTARPCAGCGAPQPLPFFELRGIPARPSVLAGSVEEALSCPRGDILLVHCNDCGFIGNQLFDPALPEYSPRTEDTQAYSHTFSDYQREMADYIVNDLGIRNRRVVEIGCGKGEFLALVCRLGNNAGTGFDPAFRTDRHPCPWDDRIRYVTDTYSGEYADIRADLFCSKMTLEHIPDVGAFLDMLRRTTAGSGAPLILFQVPDAGIALREARFFDIVYEHCSYFSAQSLRGLFQRAGFEVLDTRLSYGGQHITVEARPDGGAGHADESATLRSEAKLFATRCAERVRDWLMRLKQATEAGKRVVVWGSGSRTTTFVNLAGGDAVHRVVDINPYRQGTFIPGTGHPIVSPEALRDQYPDIVVVINRVYREEIRRTLAGMDLNPEIVTV